MSEPETAAWPRPAAEDEVRALLERARRGDLASLPELRATLDGRPELWRAYGDLAAHAQAAWIGLIAGPDLALAESLARQVEAMRGELAGPDPSPLESLLVGRIVACWLQVGYSDAAVARAGDVSLRQADFARKRQDSAHKKYLSAIGALAMVRKLLGAGDPRRAGRTTARPADDIAGDAREGEGIRLAGPTVDRGGG